MLLRCRGTVRKPHPSPHRQTVPRLDSVAKGLAIREGEGEGLGGETMERNPRLPSRSPCSQTRPPPTTTAGKPHRRLVPSQKAPRTRLPEQLLPLPLPLAMVPSPGQASTCSSRIWMSTITSKCSTGALVVDPTGKKGASISTYLRSDDNARTSLRTQARARALGAKPSPKQASPGNREVP